MLTPIEIGKFSGLNLAADPQEVGWAGAIDGMNFSLDYEGRLAPRSGLATFLTGLTTGDPSLAIQASATGHVVFVGNGVGAYSYDGAGTLLAQDPTFRCSALVRTGTASSARVYAASADDGLHYWSVGAASWTHSPSFTSPVYRMAVTPWDNRLALITGVAIIRFSDPGFPETVNNDVTLDPNDGESIEDVIAWRDLLFVFKQTKFYVFYGVSVASDGSPIFNYRKFDGFGATFTNYTRKIVAANREGVFFLAPDGVYLTTGGVPTKISSAVDPLFAQKSLPYWTGPAVLDTSIATLGVVADKVYVCPSPAQSLTLVYDISSRQWTAYDWRLNCITPYGTSSSVAAFPLVGIGAALYRHQPNIGDDHGTAINVAYRTGFGNPGQPGAETRIREWLLDGSGTASIAVSVNDAITVPSPTSVVMGGGTSTALARYRVASRARNFSVSISGTGTGLKSVSRIIANVAGQRPVGEQAA